MSTSRNAACPCGSGLKFKRCCHGKVPLYRRSGLTGFVLGLALIAGLFILAMAFSQTGDDAGGPPGPAPPGKVWSYEHGHWHDT